MLPLTRLDRAQQERADIETKAGRTYEVRFVVTKGDKGARILAHAHQGRHTFDSPEEAQGWINAAFRVNSLDTLRSVYGDPYKLQVRAVACYPGHHDPLSAYFASDEEAPELYLAGVAFDCWSKLTENERHGVRFGLFPHDKIKTAEFQLTRAGVELRDSSRKLAVALMEVAAHTPSGISLASLSKVQRKRKAVTRA